MKDKKEGTRSWISFRVKPEEYEKIHSNFSKTTCRKLSEYARNVLLNKPVSIKFRSQSADDFLQEMIGLKKELNAIGNNFNQAVKRLHAAHQLPEIKTWLLTAGPMLELIRERSLMIQEKLNQIHRQWSSVSAARTV